MIARLTSDTELDLPASPDASEAAHSTDPPVSDTRRQSWHDRGRSQVVFNGPPRSSDLDTPDRTAQQN